MITQRLIQLIKPYWVRLLAAMFCMLMFGGLTALMAFMVKPVLDDLFFQKKISMLALLPPFIILLFCRQRDFSPMGNPI